VLRVEREGDRRGEIGERLPDARSSFEEHLAVAREVARELAREVLAMETTVGVRLDQDRIHVETLRPDDLYERLAPLVVDDGFEIEELDSEDASLDAIFEYLVG
jgi:hypothetical protein